MTLPPGYRTHIVINEDHAPRIPDSPGLDVAAPLRRAGITTCSPLSHRGAGPGKRVAVIGLDGSFESFEPSRRDLRASLRSWARPRWCGLARLLPVRPLGPHFLDVFQ